ncbi:protein INVOLVED IN DE NOVO 2-like isoform X2 [Oryza brachyantha]|uniref:protein INVOLVED IN DE NOVO 2-like isoform X2 n=1 Tax=Oryza brachyantha TaxID=4533 RepID=UPI000776A0D4|nr:protein INVOLVED IN DE NOVO 2-like isoform X2 [Oryza brachyantha]
MAESRNAGDDLGGRMQLISSKVESKIFFHKDAMVEYVEIKKVIGDLSEEKARMEQEHHGRVAKELLEPLQERLDAANRELLSAKQQIVQVREELVAAKQQLGQKNGELELLRKKIQEDHEGNTDVLEKTNAKVHHQQQQHHDSSPEHFQSNGVQTRSMRKGEKLFQEYLGYGRLEHDLNARWSGRQQLIKDTTIGRHASRDDDLDIIREKLIKGFIEIDAEHHIGIKEIGVLNDNPFQSACGEKLPPEEADTVASEMNSLWQKLLNDTTWNPFHTITVDNDRQVEVIDADDEKLKELNMTWGEGPYKSVTDALLERKEYSIQGPGVFDLWNYREGRRASPGECIEYIFDQVKQLKQARRKSPRLGA